MNDAFVPGSEAAFVVSALDALHESTGIQGEVIDTPHVDTDVTIRLHMIRSAGIESDMADKLLNQFERGLRH